MDIDGKEIVEMIKSGGRTRETGIKHLFYNELCRNAIKSIVMNYGGNNFDVEDVYQETVLIVDRKIRNNDYNQESSLSTFTIGVGKHIWLNRCRHGKRFDYTDDLKELDMEVHKTPEYVHINNEQKTTLKDLLDHLGTPCKELLTLWKLSYTMQEVAEKLGLSSAAYARKRKFRCMKVLMENIKENDSFKELFVA